MDLHAWITQQVEAIERSVEDDVLPSGEAEVVLRRCEADRRVLARHDVAPTQSHSHLFATACEGCGTEGDCDDPVTENLNDCPELLDLAHAHGITPEILSGLDRPQPPERRPRTGPRLGLADIRTPIGEVPAALRGPTWRST